MTQIESEFLTAKELAKLLRVRERKVYELASSGELPCSRATGKLLFPRDAVDAWLASKSSGTAPSAAAQTQLPNVFLGSHDPLLEWAMRQSRAGLATYFDGSFDGLERFANGEGVATGLHVYSPDQDAWNVPTVQQRFGQEPVVLVEWAWRERGLVIDPGNAERITGIADLKGRRVTPRQIEAGSQKLFLHLLDQAGLAPDYLQLTDPARTETDAVLAVMEGKAEAAFGLRSIARQFRLDFVPIVHERFDLLIDRCAWFEEPMQRLIEFWGSDAFRTRVEELGGYDARNIGRIHLNGPRLRLA